MAVADWRAWMLAKPVMAPTGTPTCSTLSGKTVKNVMALVSAAFDVAMNDDFDRLVAYNPVTGMAPTARALARSSWNQDLEILYVAQNSATAPRGAPSGKFTIFNLMSIRTGLCTIAQSWAYSQEMSGMYRDRTVR